MSTGQTALAVLTMSLFAVGASPTTAVAQTPPQPASQAPGFEGSGNSRFKLIVNGAFGVTKLDFSGTRRFTEFAEEGQVRSDYSADAGPGFEAGLSYRFSSHLGVALSGSYLTRDSSAGFQADLPHPLYLGKDRVVTSNADGLSYSEMAGHLDLVLSGRSGSWDFSLFAGPSLFKVKADLLEPPTYTHAYPFDTVTVTAVPTSSADDMAFGFNAGAGIDLRLSDKFAIGVQGRFSRGQAKLPTGTSDEVEVDAGGLQVGAGIRVHF